MGVVSSKETVRMVGRLTVLKTNGADWVSRFDKGVRKREAGQTAEAL